MMRVGLVFDEGENFMKKLFCISLILCIFISLSGCAASNIGIHSLFGKDISLHQPMEEISLIEFGYSPWDENQIIYELSETEQEAFLGSLLSLKCHKRSSPSGHHGALYIQITYDDGSVEILGSSSLRYISGEHEEHDGWYYLMEEDLYTLFSEYTDLSALPYWK